MARVQSFCKRNVMEWSRMLYIYIYIYIYKKGERDDRQIDIDQICIQIFVVRFALSQFIAIQLIQDLIQKLVTITKQNITKRAFSRKKEHIILSSFRKENIFMTFQEEEQFRKMDEHFSQINTCHATQFLMCLYVQVFFFQLFQLENQLIKFFTPNFHVNFDLIL